MAEDIFKPVSEEEIERRDKKHFEEHTKPWIERLELRKDVTKNPDGSYDVGGDLIVDGVFRRRFSIQFNKIAGSFICWHNSLDTLEGFPGVVCGDLYFLNNTDKISEKDIRQVCWIKGQYRSRPE